MLVERHGGDIMRPSMPKDFDLPLLELHSYGPSWGMTAAALAVQLTAEKCSEGIGDDKKSACRKTIQSDSSNEAL